MKATEITLAGVLLLALAGCNDDAAPVAKDTGQAEQVAAAPATAGGAVVDTVPDAPAASAPQPNARLLHPTNLAPRTATRTVGAGVSARIDVFFDELGRYGSWVKHPDFSYVWLPGHQGRGWRPYQEGRWLWTDEHGWYWESAEPFAWAVYHYGRWSYDPDLGWFWVPGDTWAPAWVTWHHGGGRTGWAPIAPDRKGYAIGAPKRFVSPVVEGWVFVEDRNFADPALGQYVLPIRQIGAMLGGASDVDASRGFRREDIERFGGRRLEKRELVYVGNDGDAFEDVRGGRIGIYRPMIEDGEARQPPHVVVTDVTRVDRVVIREYSEVRVAGAPSVVLLTVLDKNERQKLQDDRLNQQAAAVDTQIARLQQERAAVIEERRREAERLQAQIDQERQEAALQRKQDQQRLMEARRQRAETITVDRTPAAAPAPAPTAPAAPPAPVATPAPQPAQQAPARTAPPPAVANAPAAAKPTQTPAAAAATAPAAAAAPAKPVSPTEAKSAPVGPAAQPVAPKVSVAPAIAPAQPAPPKEAKTAPVTPAAKPASPATPAVPVAAPAKPVTPTEAKAAPVGPAAQPASAPPTEAKPATPAAKPVAPTTSAAPAAQVPPAAVPAAKDQKAAQTAKEKKPAGKPTSPAPKNAPPADGSLDATKQADPARP